MIHDSIKKKKIEENKNVDYREDSRKVTKKLLLELVTLTQLYY